MNIFLTGGAGYIGSATAQALLDAGHSVTVYDSLVTGHRAAVPEKADFIHASLDDTHALADALISGEFDAVMHFAAFIEAGESMKDPGRFFHNNFVNSLSLIEFGDVRRNQEVRLFVHRGGLCFQRPASHRRFTARPDQCLWSNQIDDRANVGMVSPNPWTAFRCVALLQRLRRTARTR